MEYVLDSGVFVKLLINEEDSEKAEVLIAQIVADVDNYIVVPDIFMYEVIGICKKYDVSRSIINDTFKFYQQKYVIKVPLDGIIVDLALEMTESGHDKSGFPTFYDCVYHALAIQRDCDFITADKKHFAKVKDLGHIRLL
jgi:predicted nucleic acid-binding protein